MRVRAKFQVQRISQVSWDPQVREVTLGAVCARSIPEDQKFAQCTPSGTLVMMIDNPPAAESFVLGKCVYVDFTEAPSAESGV